MTNLFQLDFIKFIKKYRNNMVLSIPKEAEKKDYLKTPFLMESKLSRI